MYDVTAHAMMQWAQRRQVPHTLLRTELRLTLPVDCMDPGRNVLLKKILNATSFQGAQAD